MYCLSFQRILSNAQKPPMARIVETGHAYNPREEKESPSYLSRNLFIYSDVLHPGITIRFYLP